MWEKNWGRGLPQALMSAAYVCRETSMSTVKKMKNYGAKGAWQRSRDLLLNIGTPSIFAERLKLQT